MRSLSTPSLSRCAPAPALFSDIQTECVLRASTIRDGTSDTPLKTSVLQCACALVQSSSDCSTSLLVSVQILSHPSSSVLRPIQIFHFLTSVEHVTPCPRCFQFSDSRFNCCVHAHVLCARARVVCTRTCCVHDHVLRRGHVPPGQSLCSFLV